MPAARDFAVTARLATPTAALMLVLIVVGSIVRTTGSGLSCPDWPLCHGRLIPPFQFNILMEWFHRLLALLTGVGLLATSTWTFAHREVRSQLGGLAALCLVLYLSQALLGALTVWRLLDPGIVSGHLAVALLLFASLLSVALIARHEAEPEPRPLVRAGGLRTAFALASLAIWAQAVLGGMVSTNHASLACPDWPTCNGAWFPPLTGLIGLQVAHRYGAYLLVALLLTVAWRSRRSQDAVVRRLGAALGVLVVVQAAVGVTNVFLAIPVWVSALHLGLAAVLLALAITGRFRLSVATAPAAAPAAERALRGEVAR
jgi:cytochrome c oxidase assembly protein subunit 15